MVTLTPMQAERVAEAARREGVALVGVTPTEPAGLTLLHLSMFDASGDPLETWTVGTAGSCIDSRGVTVA